MYITIEHICNPSPAANYLQIFTIDSETRNNPPGLTEGFHTSNKVFDYDNFKVYLMFTQSTLSKSTLHSVDPLGSRVFYRTFTQSTMLPNF